MSNEGKDNKVEIDIYETEVAAMDDIPAIYIYCNMEKDKFSAEQRRKYIENVQSAYEKAFPNHYIIVGDVKLDLAYMPKKKALYHELKQDHRRPIDEPKTK